MSERQLKSVAKLRPRLQQNRQSIRDRHDLRRACPKIRLFAYTRFFLQIIGVFVRSQASLEQACSEQPIFEQIAISDSHANLSASFRMFTEVHDEVYRGRGRIAALRQKSSKLEDALFSKPAIVADPSTDDNIHKIEVGGEIRSYRVHAPSDGGDAPRAMVVLLHGIGRNAQSFEAKTGMNAIADREGFVTVYPDGTPILGMDRFRAWNTPNWGIFHPARGRDDVRFLSSLIEEVQKNYNIDPNKIYIAGFSNGGMLAQYFATEAPDKVAAIATVGSSLTGKERVPTAPVSVLDVHGTADPVVPYRGWPHVGIVSMEPARSTFKFWAGVNQANGTEMTQTPRMRTTSAVNGNNAIEVKQIVVKGGHHSWYRPGAPLQADRQLQTSEVVAEFLLNHGRAQRETTNVVSD